MQTTRRTLTVRNDFHSFSRSITGRDGLPSVSAVQKALRASKPADCMSSTFVVDSDGGQYIVERAYSVRGWQSALVRVS